MPLSFRETGLLRDFLNTFARMTGSTKDKLESISRAQISRDMSDALEAEAARLDESIDAATRLAEFYDGRLEEDELSLETHLADSRILCDHIRTMRAHELQRQNGSTSADLGQNPSTPPPPYSRVCETESDNESDVTEASFIDINVELGSNIRQILEARGVDENTIAAYLNTSPKLQRVPKSLQRNNTDRVRLTTLRRSRQSLPALRDFNREGGGRSQGAAQARYHVGSLRRSGSIRFEGLSEGLRSPIRPGRRVVTE